jgi:hypothetical protein
VRSLVAVLIAGVLVALAPAAGASPVGLDVCASGQHGGLDADVLRGTDADDRIRGNAGDDRLFGGRGADCLRGGLHRDLLVGGPGQDLLVGGPGDDTIRARDGEPDTVECGSGQDFVKADPGDALVDCESINDPGPWCQSPYAWINTLPARTPEFVTTITCSFPNRGYSVSLQLHQPQGADPKQVIVDLVYTKLDGHWPDIVTPFSSRYSQSPPPVMYTTARYPWLDLTIPVEIVS